MSTRSQPLPETLKPPVISTGVLGWLRQNLFSTWYNTLLTLVALGLVYLLGSGLWNFVTTADWSIVTANMRLALQKTYDAVAPPKLVVAVGACAIAGGPYIGHPEAHDGADAVVPVDLYVPGCPPHPLTILDGLLRLLGRLEKRERTR